MGRINLDGIVARVGIAMIAMLKSAACPGCNILVQYIAPIRHMAWSGAGR